MPPNPLLNENNSKSAFLCQKENFFQRLMKCDNLWILVLLIVLLMRFPAATFGFFSDLPAKPVLAMFDHAAVGLFAMGVLLFNVKWFRMRPHWFPLSVAGVMSLSALLHIFAKSTLFEAGESEIVGFYKSLDIFTGEGLMFALIPLIAILKFRTLFKVFPFFVAFIWAIDIYHVLPLAGQIFRGNSLWGVFMSWWNATDPQGDMMVSIAGNRNWQAAFLASTTFTTAYLAWHYAQKIATEKIAQWVCGSVGASIIVIMAIICYNPMNSRASGFALVVGIGVIALALFLRIFHKNKKLQYSILAGLIVLGTLGVACFMHFQGDNMATKMAKLSESDVRVPMWRAACTLIKEENPNLRPETYPFTGYHWLTGVGSTYFEDQYVVCRMPDYFTRTLPAPRTDYPHNNSFYIAGYLGVPAALGFVGLAVISMCGVFFLIIRRRKLNWKWVAILFGTVTLGFHAQLDLPLEYFPMAAIYLLSIGLCARTAWPVIYRPFNFKKTQLYLLGGCWILGAFFLVLSGTHAYRFFMHNCYQREALIIREGILRPGNLDPITTDRYVNAHDRLIWESLKWVPSMDVAYQGLISAWSYKLNQNPNLAKKYVNFIYNNSKRFNYFNTNYHAGILAQNDGNLREAEACFLRQIRAYSIGLVGWQTLRDFYRRTQQPLKAEYADLQFKKALNVRGVDEGFMSQVYQNPNLDLRPFNSPTWKRPKIYPAHDKHLWPDLSMIYRRLGRGTETFLDIKDDDLLKEEIARAKAILNPDIATDSSKVVVPTPGQVDTAQK